MSRLLLQQVLNGLAIGSVYAIFALGYTLIFSVLRIINFTHGAIFTLGAYATYALTGSQFGINGLLAGAKLPFSLPFVAALIGGLIVGVVESLAAGYLDPYVGGGTKDFAPYVLMILVLMIRPYGIFGRRQIERV